MIPQGPILNQWLPDGEKDALTVFKAPNAELRVWCERRGYVEKDFIRYDPKRKDVDPAILRRQRGLVAGPLYGQLELKAIADDRVSMLRELATGDSEYVEIGKTVVTQYFYPSISRFVDILRNTYGQYWLQPIDGWDSRYRSIGSYCLSFNMTWSLDGGGTWQDFLPDEPIVRGSVIVSPGSKENLTKDDWRELGNLLPEGFRPSFAATLLLAAHNLLENDDSKYALVEGVTALEVAMREFLERNHQDRGIPLKGLQQFFNLPAKTQVLTLGSCLADITAEGLAATISAIDMRNDIVHEGWEPTDKNRDTIRGFLETVAAFLPGPKIRFPSSHQGRGLLPPGQ